LTLATEKNDALLIMEKGKDTVSSANYLARVETEMRKLTLHTPDSRNEIRWERYGGGMIEYLVGVGGKTMQVRIFAIDYNGSLLTMMAAGYLDRKKELEQVLATVKPLKAALFPDAETALLKASAASDGETVSAFAERMGASAEIGTICLLNDRSPGEILRKGDVLKWVLRKPYRFRQADH
jgi:hypothetical protein